AGLAMVISDTATQGLIFAFIMYIPKLFRPLNRIADNFNTLQMGMVAATRVFNILDTNSQMDDKGTKSITHFKGDIVFNDIYFSYVKDETVLKGVSFEVKAGQTVAIVGATGAGKSTIINLLSRFYDIDKGVITVDGIDIKDVTLLSLRNQIAEIGRASCRE